MMKGDTMNLKEQFHALLDDLKADFTPEQASKNARLFEQCRREIEQEKLKAAANTMGRLERVLKNEC